MPRMLVILIFACWFAVGNVWLFADEEDAFFERRIRPLLANRCWKCHSMKRQEGGRRLDSPNFLREGGDSGPVLVPRDVQRSLLITAVRQTTDLKMPPDGKLPPKDVAAFERWVKLGAAWPTSDIPPDDRLAAGRDHVVRAIETRVPNDPELAVALQLWVAADSLAVSDGSPVYVWPDQSGHGHDLSATAGVRNNGVGTPPTFVARGRVNGRAAVRFVAGNGMAGSPDHLLEIHGDAALTIFLVGRWTPLEQGPPFDNVLMIGNPAAPTDPKRAWAAYLEIDRNADSFDFAGLASHDSPSTRTRSHPTHFSTRGSGFSLDGCRWACC